jgi:hypothetical protein
MDKYRAEIFEHLSKVAMDSYKDQTSKYLELWFENKSEARKKYGDLVPAKFKLDARNIANSIVGKSNLQVYDNGTRQPVKLTAWNNILKTTKNVNEHGFRTMELIDGKQVIKVFKFSSDGYKCVKTLDRVGCKSAFNSDPSIYPRNQKAELKKKFTAGVVQSVDTYDDILDSPTDNSIISK